MNALEIGIVLAKCAAYDRRKTGEADVLAWHESLTGIDLDEALEAVRVHYRTSREWIMPSDVREEVLAARRRAGRGRAAALGLPYRREPEARNADALARNRNGYAQCLAAIPPRRPAPADPAPTAMDALRDITAAPNWPDPEEVSRHALAQ